MLRTKSILLSLLTLASTSLATELRIYPTFTEVQQPVQAGQSGYDLAFPFSAWQWVQPGSLSLTGAGLTRLTTTPDELTWLRTQEGKAVRWVRPSRESMPATLERADDLLLKLESGEYVNAARSEVAFTERPPQAGGVTAHFEVNGPVKAANVLYRTAALSWRPRYELNAAGGAVNLAALADIVNRSDQVFQADKVNLFAGDVRQVIRPTSLPYPEQQMLAEATSNGATATMPMAGRVGTDTITSVGEVRGLQQYTLPGALTVDRGESVTLPFLKPQVQGFTRYASVQSYFDGQNRSGRASRHYKFTSTLSLPTGTVDVREGGLLVGTVILPAVQASKPVDLDLGSDAELRYEKTVKRTGQEKDPKGRVLSTTSQVTYTFTSTKSTAIRTNVREQWYARSSSVDGQSPQPGQVTLTRQVDVPAGGKASLTFKLKIMN